ncbi:hypothetical protein M5D96_009827 [Drosophila gunungcola]|uniref:Uncharacterized protein n=1 Tax=Drosophila gunungcola TaxID=103775 RepID=A0A9P9YHV0_9MUSC|nr:hypothetical protein M5D96_009827 [Drosophila gunungcola]
MQKVNEDVEKRQEGRQIAPEHPAPKTAPTIHAVDCTNWQRA